MNTLFRFCVLLKNIKYIASINSCVSGHGPEMVSKSSVTCTLYTNANPDAGYPMSMTDKLPAEVDPSAPWTFIMHGFTTSPGTSPWFQGVKNAYFAREARNVVFVDWSSLSGEPYERAVPNAPVGGEAVAEHILNLMTRSNVSPGSVHLIGFSLGAHAAGYAGKKVFAATGSKVSRITALDPAGPYYEVPALLPPDQRISDGDAEFVDVLHTDKGHYGMSSPVGHADFYPNGGGPEQPGCDSKLDVNCSHARAPLFYIESINSTNFLARRSDSYEDYKNGKFINDTKVIFGENVDRAARGSYYFDTNAQSPFAKGD